MLCKLIIGAWCETTRTFDFSKVCEFGAHRNIATIENAFMEVCQNFGYEYSTRFNFPICERFAELLKKLKS